MSGNHLAGFIMALVPLLAAPRHCHPEDAPTAKEVLSLAFDAALTIQDPAHKANALLDIADYQAGTGDVDEALKTAEVIDDQPGGSRYATAMREIAIAQARRGDLKQARATAETVGRDFDRAIALREIAIVQARAGDFEQAFKTVDAIKVMIAAEAGAAVSVERQEALTGIAVAQAKAGDADGAGKALAKIEHEFERQAAWVEIVKAQGEAKNWDGASKTAESLSVGLHRAAAWREIGLAQSKTGDSGAAKKSFERATETAEHDILVKPYIPVQHKALALREIGHAQAVAGDLAGAAVTLHKAAECAASIEDKFATRTMELNQVATAQAEAGLLKDALATTELVADESSRQQLLAWVVDASLRGGHFDDALGVVTSLKAPAAKAKLLVSIAVAENGRGERDATAKTLATATELAKQLDDSAREGVLAQITIAKGAAGDVDAARDAIRKAQETITFGEPFAQVGAGLANAGRTKEALRLAEEITEPATRCSFLFGVATALAAKAEKR